MWIRCWRVIRPLNAIAATIRTRLAAGPDANRKRAVLVYCNLIKAAYKDVPLVIGGVEVVLVRRRVAHYDFWSNKVRRSIIADSRADISGLPGNGRTGDYHNCRAIENTGEPARDSRNCALLSAECPSEAYLLSPEEEVLASKETFVEFLPPIVSPSASDIGAAHRQNVIFLHYPPAEITPESLDAIYALPFMRPTASRAIPNKIPAFEMIRDSVTAHRGCVFRLLVLFLNLAPGEEDR